MISATKMVDGASDALASQPSSMPRMRSCSPKFATVNACRFRDGLRRWCTRHCEKNGRKPNMSDDNDRAELTARLTKLATKQGLAIKDADGLLTAAGEAGISVWF